MDKRVLYRVFKEAFLNWFRGNATLHAAALTFFIILPLPTLLILVNVVFGYFFGVQAASQLLVQQIESVAGPAVTQLFSQLIASTASPFTSAWTTIVVVGFSVAGAVGAFAVLRSSMDSIWGVKLPKKLPLWKRLRQTVLPFVLVSALGLIVIAWTALASGLFNVIAVYSSGTLSGFVLLGAAQAASTFVVATLLLAIIYKMIPQVKVHWHDVRLAAVATGLAFTVTNYVFGAYIQVFVVTTVAGAAGALLIILLWIFVLNQIVLFGAELSRAVATTVGAYAGQRVLPEPVERLVDPLQRAGELFEWVTKGEIEYVEPQKNVQNSEEKPEKTGKTEN